MMKKTTLLLAMVTLVLGACGGGEGANRPTDPDAPVLQVTAEGGFVPVEWNFGRGPDYTLLGDGRLIYSGPVIDIYPGPLLPNYQVVSLDQARVDTILRFVDDIGLPTMNVEEDDSAVDHVADATTTVFTYWDGDGHQHVYSVYGLGITPGSPLPATAAAMDLENALGEAAAASSQPYVGDRVRVVAGISQAVAEPGQEDVRDWPLPGEDPAQWSPLNLGYACKVFGPEVLDRFSTATQLTQWANPSSDVDTTPYTLLVRPLHPGEPDCQTAD
jgi:hypothetical protein